MSEALDITFTSTDSPKGSFATLPRHLMQISPQNSSHPGNYVFPDSSISVDIPPTAPAQIEDQEPQVRRRLVPIQLYLVGKIGSLALVNTLAIASLLYTSGIIKLEAVLILVYSLLFCMIVRNSVLLYFKLLENWRPRDYKLDLAFYLATLLSVVCVELTLRDLIPFSVVGAFPLIGTVLARYHFSERPGRGKLREDFVNTAYMIQIYTIMLQVDKTITLNWIYVLAPSLLFLGLKSLKAFKYLFLVAKLLVTALFKANREADRDLPREIKANIWCLLNYAIYIAALISVFGLGEALDGRMTWDLFQFSSVGAFIVACIALAFMTTNLVAIIDSIENYNLLGDDYISSEDEEELNQKQTKIEFKSEQVESCFVKVSPTYFRTVAESSIVENGAFQGSDLREASLKKILTDQDGEPKAQGSSYEERGTTKGSDSDQNNSGDWNKKELYSTTEENLCYICYCDDSNVVFEDCGHGGVCYECAKALILKNTQCTECRTDVHAFYKIDPKPSTNGTVKACERVKVIVTFVNGPKTS